MLPKQQLVPCLGYLGLAPFLVAAYLSATGQAFLEMDPVLLFIGYSAVILALFKRLALG